MLNANLVSCESKATRWKSLRRFFICKNTGANTMADRYKAFAKAPDLFGTKAEDGTPNNSTDLASVAKAIEVTSVAGGTTLRVLPVDNDDGEWITYTGVTVGFTPKLRVRRVHTDTNCSYAVITG